MNHKLSAVITISLALFGLQKAYAQDIVVVESEDDPVTEIVEQYVTSDADSIAPDGRRWVDIPDYEIVGMALDTLIYVPPLPSYFFRPTVYDHFEYPEPLGIDKPVYTDRPAFRWIEELNLQAANMKQMNDYIHFYQPQLVKYNSATMLTAPKFYETVLNPTDHTIQIREIPSLANDQTTLVAEEVKKRHWIRTFNASLQFSQAYVSPNWYQGGNNNVNMLGQLYYNVKLNQEFHPKLLFDFTAQYKLGINSAPDDSIRNYSISDDLLQLNTTFGIKATTRWYYSFTGQFKTQILDSYTSNTRNLRSSFLSPGEFTGGVGMTYNYANKPKTLTFDASINPLTYNLKICTNSRLDETAYGIKPGHKTLSQYGSSAELKLYWKMAYNISLRSRLFTFSDFSNLQADWENTIQFEINRFLTTQIYAHLRYDTRGVSAEGTNWKKLQLKEILSFGFAYKFSSL